MPAGLLEYIKRLASEGGPASGLDCPVLVWDGMGERSDDEVALTSPGTSALRPRPGEPLVLEVRKGTHKANAFALGITVGRVETNDLPLGDASVSRFHAYFQKSSKSALWRLTDADSKNGTWVNAVRLAGSAPADVIDQSRLRFGDVEVQFFEPESFDAYLRGIVGPIP